MPVWFRECFWRVFWCKISCGYRPDNWNEFHDHENDFNGDENQINGEEYDFNGDENQINGDENDFNGEENQINGEEYDFNGEENQINGEEYDFNGEENQINGEEYDFNGEENAFSWWWKLVILVVINKLSLGQENHGKWGYILELWEHILELWEHVPEPCQCVFIFRINWFAQVAPPELIIFVFALYYKRYAPPELWLLLWKRYSYQCDDNNDRQELWLCMKTIFILTSKINIAPAEHAVCRNRVEIRVKLRRSVLFFPVLCFFVSSWNRYYSTGRSSGANYICICVVLQTVCSSGALVIFNYWFT